METIFALSSGAGKAGVAVIRASGPAVSTLIETLTGRSPPAARKAALCCFYDRDGGVIDQGLLLFFPAPKSVTGEDVAEFHVHGSLAVVDAMLLRLGSVSDCRPAYPGEFSRRAFDHGKLDLTELEGLADLIDAESEAQRRQAVAQLSGRLGALYEGWRDALLQALAELEAVIDFADEDLPDQLEARVAGRITPVEGAIRDHLNDGGRGEAVRRGLQVAILGAPNAGKSSLLNALSDREAAIVSDIPGTTRDVIDVRMTLAGVLVSFVDTAGLRDSLDEIEQEGVRRALARANDADILLYLRDARDELGQPLELPGTDEADPRLMRLASKADLAPVYAPGWVPVSVKTKDGLSDLMRQLTARLGELGPPADDAPRLTRTRHREGLTDCRDHLARFQAMIDQDAVLACEDLRLAARALGRVVGKYDVEDVLDRIFAGFCIGK